MEPDPSKIQALTKTEPPKNVSGLRMLNYSSQFIKSYSNKTAKLRELLHYKKKWSWTSEHQRCFDELKISNSNVLGCFDVKAKRKVLVGAPTVGLGAILVQTTLEKVAHASRSLNETENVFTR